MRTRRNAIADEPLTLYQYFTDSATGALMDLDGLPVVKIYAQDPARNNAQTPIATLTPEQQLDPLDAPIPGSYAVEFSHSTSGWFWDQWTILNDSKEYIYTSSFYIGSGKLLTASDYPIVATPFKAELLTQTVYIGGKYYVVMQVSPTEIPAPEARLKFGDIEVIPWSVIKDIRPCGKVFWLLDVTDENLDPGIYCIELRSNYGAEIHICSPLYLKLDIFHG